MYANIDRSKVLKSGVLLNSGDAIERLAEAGHVIFDKIADVFDEQCLLQRQAATVLEVQIRHLMNAAVPRAESGRW